MRRAALEERVTILEERFRVLEAPPEYKLGLADARAQARTAEQRLQRTIKTIRRSVIAGAAAGTLSALVAVTCA
ncbi:MAG: hypothetical protein AB1679_06100 [Actinomycetota bacterium]